MARRRPSRGRQRIEIRRIEDEQARHVCFSKRRPGLFKKCSELATMCGAEVAALVFSPATTDKAFSFGHPSVEAIIERFDPTGLMLAGAAGTGGDDNKQLVALRRRGAELSVQVDMEKARKERAEAAMAKERAKANPLAKWLQANVHDLGMEELVPYAAAMAAMKAAVAAHSNQVLQDARTMAAAARSRSSHIIRQALLATLPEQFHLANNNNAMASSSNNNYQAMQAPPPQQFLFANHGSAGFGLDQYSAGIANNNAPAQMDMQIQQMMMPMAMPPPLPGFAAPGMEMMLLQQGFGGFPGPY